MTNLKHSKIGRRIVLLVFVAVTLSTVTLAGIFLILQLQENIQTRKESVRATGYVYASAIADYVAAGNSQGVLSVLRSIERVPHVTAAIAFDDQDRQVASLGSSAILVSDIVTGEDGIWQTLYRGSLSSTVDIVRATRLVGRLTIVTDVSSLRNQLHRSILLTLVSALAAGFLGMIVAARLQRRISGPILSLTRAMAHIREARDYATQVAPGGNDETGVLVETFNGMMTEISTRDVALEKLAFFDSLTGLSNRQQFQNDLEQLLTICVNGNKTASLFLLDLDEFKSVNDTYGHTAGDSLLVSVAERFRKEGGSRMKIARLGGDEFAIICPDIGTEAEAMESLAPLVASLSQPVLIHGRQVLTAASGGVAMIPRDGSTVGDLLRRADLALYSAKHEGRGRVHFYRPSLDEEAQLRTELAIDLRQAISGNQLEVHYQPQINLTDGSARSFESLLRWKHPVRGYVSPAVFVPIAESNGLISELGQWVMAESCRQAAEWLAKGFPLRRISVNVSIAQIREADFAHQVEDILRISRLPPSILCLEVTESVFAGGAIRQLRKVLESLKGIGVLLAIDDFGTGYSSMSYLQNMPFDKLKIDRAFVDGADKDSDKRRLLKGMIELGHALDLSICAEGAEKEGEVALLRELKAEQVQGFVFSKPVPAAEIPAVSRRIEESLLVGQRAVAS